MSTLDRLTRAGILALFLGALALGAWAALAPLSGAVIASGFVKVDLNRKVVQHQEGGIVRAIHVRDGDRVRQGQPVVDLQDVRVDASLQVLRLDLLSERARAARLLAEASSAAAPAFPPDVTALRGEPRVAEIIARETAIFRAQRESLDSQLAALQKQGRESGVEAAALMDQLAAEDRAIAYQKEELAANEDLLRRHFVQKSRVLTLQREVAQGQARRGEHRAELSKARQKAAEVDLRIIALRNTYRQTAITELKAATSRIAELEERLRPSQDAADRQQLVAPIAGEVVGLRVTNAGAVVGPREVLMEIIPDDQRLVVEARIRPEDINHVHAGAAASVRLTAYAQRTTPQVAGTVTYVSGDRLVDEVNHAPYYVMNVAIFPESLASAGNLKLQAGMPAEVFVETDRRTTLDYLLAPAAAYLGRAMREPI